MKRTLLLMIVAFGLGGWLVPAIQARWVAPVLRAYVPEAGLGIKPPPPATALDPAEVYARAAQAASPSVVNIDTLQRVRVRGFFLGDDVQENRSEGSGVIIDGQGHILTNEHVVGAANEAGKKILVTLSDGRKFPGTIVGADRTTDVALVKIDGQNLPTARIGTAKGLVPGQMAIAIGNPFGLRFTVNHGVVSALGRPISTPDGRVYSELIQHDAFINPGNSGGALVNLRGELIGINTLVDSRAQGIGFAIPVDAALKVADELKRFGKVKRPWLGMVVEANNPYFVQRYGLPDVQGVVVRGLYREGPAARAGLEAGDVITRLAGKPVRDEDGFGAIERSLRIGSEVEFEAYRGDERVSGRMRVGESP